MLDPRESLEEGVRYQKLGMLDRALAEFRGVAERSDDPAVVAQALCREALAFRAGCQWYEAIAAARRCAAVAREANLPHLIAEGLNAEAIVHEERGDFDAAAALLSEILALQPDDRLAGLAHQNLGAIAAQRAELSRAEQHFERSYEHFIRADYRWGQAFALNNRAAVALDSGRLREAEILGGQALIAANQVGDLELSGIASLNVAESLAAQGRVEDSERRALQALGYFGAEENSLRTAQCLRVLGDIMLMRGERESATRLYQQALELARRIGVQREVARIEDCMQLVAPAG